MQEEKQCGQHQEPSYKSRKVYKWIVCDLLNLKTREFMKNLPELTYLEDIDYTDFYLGVVHK